MVERISYRGWNNAWRLANGTVELIVLADVGPRIVYYGFCGAGNILFEVPGDAGCMGGTDFRLFGGHRLWVWPEVARTYFPDNRPVSVRQNGDTLCCTSPIEDFAPGAGLQKEFEITIDKTGTRVRVVHRIINRGAMATELAVWCPTMMRAGGRAILPLPPRVAMDTEHFQSVGPLTLWSFTDLADPRWILSTEFIQLRQEPRPKGRFPEQMTGIFDPDGWGAYFAAGTLFVKKTTPIAGAAYPDFGCNFEVFTNPEFLELESLGPRVELLPGESTSHTEIWSLFRDVPAGEDDAWIRSAVAPRALSAKMS
jgi:hypothetical protein